MGEIVESATVIKLLLNYFSAVNIHYVTVLYCGQPEENHYLVKSFSKSAIFVDLVKLNNDSFDAERHARQKTNGHRTKIGTVLHFECPGSDNFISKCAHMKCFSASIYWVITTRKENQIIFDFLSTVDLFVDAEIKVLTPDGLYDVYNNGRPLGGQINVTLDRTINQELGTLGPSRLDGRPKYEHRRTLSDLTMRVGTVSQRFPRLNDSIEQIVKHLESDNDRHVDHGLRFGHRMTHALHSTLNYNIHYIHYDCWSFNDSTGGILGALINQEIDYSVAGLMTKVKRMEHLASVVNYMNFELMFIFKTPEATQLLDNAFIRPFQINVWIMILVTIMLGSIAMKLSFTVESKLDGEFKATENPSFSSLIIEFLGNYCQQGSQYIPESLSGRSMQLFILLCTLVVYNYYTSEIVSDLIGSHKESSIKTLVQLADSHMELGIENVIYEKAFFYESHLADVDYLTRKKVTDKTFVNSSVGIARVRRGNFAYNCERSVAYNLIRNTFDSKEVCDLNEVDSMIKFLDHLVRKDSPFRELFKVRYSRILEVGIKKKFSDYWITKRPVCSSRSIISSVTIAGALPIFVLLGLGLMLSVVVFGVEVLVQFAGQKFGMVQGFDQIIEDRSVKKKFL